MYSYQSNGQKSLQKTYVGMFIMSLLVFWLGYSYLSTPDFDTYAVAANPPELVETVPVVEEWVPELPVRMLIPAIDVDAAVQYVGLDETGDMEVPSNFTDVAWYEAGVQPGMKGSAVIAGHYNGRDIPEAVFYNLDELKVGDEVVIMSEHRIEDIFRVVRIETYAHDEPATDVFVSTDAKKRLNLITCAGEWLSDEGSYNERTVVFTELLTDVE